MSDTTPLRSDWGSLSGLSPDRIWNARVQAHYALQLPAALHVSRYAPRDDQSHTAFVDAAIRGSRRMLAVEGDS